MTRCYNPREKPIFPQLLCPGPSPQPGGVFPTFGCAISNFVDTYEGYTSPLMLRPPGVILIMGHHGVSAFPPRHHPFVKLIAIGAHKEGIYHSNNTLPQIVARYGWTSNIG